MSKAVETQIPLKILVDKARNKVLFAEADYRFVDILFGFMTLPMRTVVRLVGENSDLKFPTIGSFNTLCEGLANLPSECFWKEECKAVLLTPVNSSSHYCSQLELNVEDTLPTKYFTCEKCKVFFSVCNYAKCKCGKLLNVEMSPQKDSIVKTDQSERGVFVNGTASFIITDDLHVKPNSPGSSIRMLNDLGIGDMSNLEEMTITIGIIEVLKLFRLALFSNYPLTNLFLRKQVIQELLVRYEPGNVTLPNNTAVTASSGNSKKFNAKAFLRNSNGELLFLQADGDFIDFLFSFLVIPLGTVKSLLSGIHISPSIDNIYSSLSSLNVGPFMKSKDLKDRILNPPVAGQYFCKNQIFPLKPGGSFPFHGILTLNNPKLEGEFARGTTMFMVTDNLVVTPLSSLSTLSYLNNLKVPLRDVVDYEVSIGIEEALGILKASLTSSSALSSGLSHLLLKKPKLEN